METFSANVLICCLTLLVGGGDAVVTTYTLDLAQDTGYTNTSLQVGQTQVLVLTASFEPSRATDAVEIELMPSVTTTVFAIGSLVSASVGSQLTVANTNFFQDAAFHKPLDQDLTSVVQYDTRVVFDLGTVTSAGAGSADADNQIVIKFEVVMVSMGGQLDQSESWVSAGFQYDNGNYLWIAQISYTLVEAIPTVNEVPSIEVSDIMNLELMTPTTAGKVTMNLPNVQSKVVAEVLFEANAAHGILIPELLVESFGAAYNYSTVLNNAKTDGYSSCPLKSSIVLDLGTLVNKESQKTTPVSSDNDIVFVVKLQATDDSVVGETFTVAVTVTIQDTKTYVVRFNVTVEADSSPPLDVSSFTSAVLAGSESVSPGFMGFAEVEISVPEGSHHSYTLQLSTAVASAASNALSIIVFSNTGIDAALHCIVDDLQLTRTQNGNIYDAATGSFRVLNTGVGASPGVGKITLRVGVMMFPLVNLATSETFTLSINVNGLGEQQVTFTAAAPADFPTDLSYDITLGTHCGGVNFHVGSEVLFNVTVTTERDRMAGPMTIEAPIPEDLVNSNLTFSSAKVLSKGINVVCTEVGDIDAVLSDWSPGSGANDRAVLTIPMVCNMMVVDDVKMDKMVIQIGVHVKETAMTMAEDYEQMFGVGVMFSSNQIWVASFNFNVLVPRMAPSYHLSGVHIENVDLLDEFPGTYKLQWSPDKVSFYDSHQEWDLAVVTASGKDYPLKLPLVGKYFRFVGPCGPVAYTILEPSTSPMRFYTTSPGALNLLAHSSFYLDGDNSTCMPLPTKNSTNTPQYFWVSMDLALFGRPTQNTSFFVTLIGKGLTCNNKYGPQVTKVTHNGTSSTQFTGIRPLCSAYSESDEDPLKTCTYMCDCDDVTTCLDFSLLMYDTGMPVGDYELCDVTISDTP